MIVIQQGLLLISINHIHHSHNSSAICTQMFPTCPTNNGSIRETGQIVSTRILTPSNPLFYWIWKLKRMKWWRAGFHSWKILSHSWIEPYSNVCLWNREGFGTSLTGILNPDSLVCTLSGVSQQMSVGEWLSDNRMRWICCDQTEDALWTLWLPDKVHSNLMYVYGRPLLQAEYWTVSGQQVRLVVAPLDNG